MTKETNQQRCIICGTKKEVTSHSVFGKHKQPHVPICKEHHVDIENIKLVIDIMKKKKTCSVRSFRNIMRTIEKVEVKKK